MGFYIAKINNGKLEEYIGSQTMYSCADNGAFDCIVSQELENIANKYETIVAVVDKIGVINFLNILKNGNCIGRDVGMFIKVVEKNYMDGFIIHG